MVRVLTRIPATVVHPGGVSAISRVVEERSDDTPGRESRFPSDPGRDRSNSMPKSRAHRVRQATTIGKPGRHVPPQTLKAPASSCGTSLSHRRAWLSTKDHAHPEASWRAARPSTSRWSFAACADARPTCPTLRQPSPSKRGVELNAKTRAQRVRQTPTLGRLGCLRYCSPPHNGPRPRRSAGRSAIRRVFEEPGDDTSGGKSRIHSDPGGDRRHSTLKPRARRVRQHPTLGGLGGLGSGPRQRSSAG